MTRLSNLFWVSAIGILYLLAYFSGVRDMKEPE